MKLAVPFRWHRGRGSARALVLDCRTVLCSVAAAAASVCLGATCQADDLPAQPAVGAAQGDTFASLAADYGQVARPLLQAYCADCHTGESHEGEFDLQAFAEFGQVRRRPQPWQKVDEMLRLGEMPPAEAPQPPEGDRQRLHHWVKQYLRAEAQAGAGGETRSGDPLLRVPF